MPKADQPVDPEMPKTSKVDPKVTEALDLYAEWLNRTNLASDPTWDTEYTSQDFLDYPITIIIDSTNYKMLRRILNFTCTNGDEGGPAALTLFINQEADELDAILQEFDTYFTLIYDRSQGGLINPFTHQIFT